MNELRYFTRRKNEDEELFERIVQIKTDEIRPNRAQPRSDFNQNSIIRLADSIRRYGILQPLTVRRADPDDSYRYELIAGERRLRAARMLGYLTVPCVIKETDEETAAELSIIENLLREDLNMFEEANGYKKLIEIHHLTQEEVARRMSSSQSAVANKLRLLKLTYKEQLFVLESKLTERHARAVLRIEDPEERYGVLCYIAENKLNVSETEEYVENKLKYNKTQDALPKNHEKMAVCIDKDQAETVGYIRKRVDNWVKAGGNAEISVTNRNDMVEVNIKLYNRNVSRETKK